MVLLYVHITIPMIASLRKISASSSDAFFEDANTFRMIALAQSAKLGYI